MHVCVFASLFWHAIFAFVRTLANIFQTRRNNAPRDGVLYHARRKITCCETHYAAFLQVETPRYTMPMHFAR